MHTKKTATKKGQVGISGVRIENVHIENGTVTKAASDAIIALAQSVTENAKAIQEIAKRMQPAAAEMKYGIALFGGHE